MLIGRWQPLFSRTALTIITTESIVVINKSKVRNPPIHSNMWIIVPFSENIGGGNGSLSVSFGHMVIEEMPSGRTFERKVARITILVQGKFC